MLSSQMFSKHVLTMTSSLL
uniref:Uncharacterized protein n=1 Tax=Arundo donax TaxID=35708 RepID=A0A0A9C783_ARUDO